MPPTPGLYLLDVVPEGDLRWGFPNINDNAEIAELIACGSHVILFTTGRGSVVGSAIATPSCLVRHGDSLPNLTGAGRASIGEIAYFVAEVRSARVRSAYAAASPRVRRSSFESMLAT